MLLHGVGLCRNFYCGAGEENKKEAVNDSPFFISTEKLLENITQS